MLPSPFNSSPTPVPTAVCIFCKGPSTWNPKHKSWHVESTCGHKKSFEASTQAPHRPPRDRERPPRQNQRAFGSRADRVANDADWFAVDANEIAQETPVAKNYTVCPVSYHTNTHHSLDMPVVGTPTQRTITPLSLDTPDVGTPTPRIIDSGCAPLHLMKTSSAIAQKSHACDIKINAALSTTHTATLCGPAELWTTADNIYGDNFDLRFTLPGTALFSDSCDMMLISMSALIDAGWFVDLHANVIITPCNWTIRLHYDEGLWYLPFPEGRRCPQLLDDMPQDTAARSWASIAATRSKSSKPPPQNTPLAAAAPRPTAAARAMPPKQASTPIQAQPADRTPSAPLSSSPQKEQPPAAAATLSVKKVALRDSPTQRLPVTRSQISSLQKKSANKFSILGNTEDDDIAPPAHDVVTESSHEGDMAAVNDEESTTERNAKENKKEKNFRLWTLIHNNCHLHSKRMKLIAEAMHEDDPFRPDINTLFRWTQNYTCGPCQQGQPVHPNVSRVFPPRSEIEDNKFKPGQKLHLDCTGHFCPERPAVGGEDCGIVLVCVKSKHTVFHAVQDKTSSTIVSLLQRYQAESGVKMLHVQTDPEFITAEIQAFCDANGTRLTSAAPRAQHQNHLAELHVKALKNHARTCRLASYLGAEYIAYCYAHAAQSLNRTPLKHDDHNRCPNAIFEASGGHPVYHH